MLRPGRDVATWFGLAIPLLFACACTGVISGGDDGVAKGDQGSSSDAGVDSSSSEGDTLGAPSDETGGSPADSAPSAADAGAPADETSAIDSTPPPIDAAPPPTSKGGKLVGYYASWTRTTMPPSTVPWKNVTHIAHAFILPSAGGGLSNVSSYVDAELISTAHAHGVKVVASVGGAGANFDANTDPTARAKTVAAMASLCKSNGYDGIDLDWEFPDATTSATWGAMIDELRAALDAIDPALTISAAVASGAYYGDHLPTTALKKLSWVGVMTYDYAGDWSSSSGHDSPLYPSKGGDGGSVTESIDYFVKKRGISPSSLLVGLPFYGRDFGATTIAGTPVKPSTDRDYRDVVSTMSSGGWTKAWDSTAHVPYLTRTPPSGQAGFLSYDDAKSIGEKCTFAKSQALGGAIVWHLAGDRLSDGSNPLLDAAQPCR